MKKLFGNKLIRYVFIAVLFFVAAILLFMPNLEGRILELRLLRLFDLQIDNNVLISKVERGEYNTLHAELIVSKDEIEVVFEAYQHLTKETDVQYLPPYFRRRIDVLFNDYELDYFYALISSARIGFFIEIMEKRSQYIIFMKEKDGNILVLLSSTHSEGIWR